MTDKKPPVSPAWGFVWLLVFGGIFALLETIALTNDTEGDTLSEVTRFLVYGLPWGVGMVLFIAFFIWFIPHVLKRSKEEAENDDNRPE